MSEPLVRDSAILAIAAAARRAGAVVFAGNGFNARALAALADHPDNFYMLGSMGLGPVLAAGFSRCSGTPTVVIEGDGNALMGLSGHPAALGAARTPFVHCVLDNGVYETTGGQRTLSPAVDMMLLARGCGYPEVHRVATGGELTARLDAALARRRHTFVQVQTRRSDGPTHPRVPYDPPQVVTRFGRFVPGEAAAE